MYGLDVAAENALGSGDILLALTSTCQAHLLQIRHTFHLRAFVSGCRNHFAHTQGKSQVSMGE